MLLENVNLKDSWIEIIEKFNLNAVNKTDDILNIIQSNKKEIYPLYENIFKCFNYCDISEIKVVIIGQDPYHGYNQATGLAFAVNNNLPIPPSLRNIINELKSDIGTDLIDTSLEHWAKQGVLLLNSSLSVIQSTPGSQMKLWSVFTDHIISKLNEQANPIIFLAWGAFAHKKLSTVDVNKHHIIVSSHPSPLSYYKKYKQFPQFKDSKPFSKINDILINQTDTPIDW